MNNLTHQSKTRYLSIKDAAKKLKVSTKTLRRWEERNILVPARTSGGHRRYNEDQLNALKNKHTDINSPTIRISTEPTPSNIIATPQLYEGLHIDQIQVLRRLGRLAIIVVFMIVSLKSVSAITPDTMKSRLSSSVDSLTHTISSFSTSNKREENDTRVLALTTSSLSDQSFNVYVNTNLKSDTDIAGNLNLSGNTLSSTGTLVINSEDNAVIIGSGLASQSDLLEGDVFITDDLEIGGTAFIPTLTIGGDTFTDLTGTGLQVTNNVLETFLGTSIESSEITDGTIAEADLSITNTPGDNQILSYDSSTGTFTWVDDEVGATPNELFTDGGAVTYLTSLTDDFAIGGSTTSAALYFDESAGDLSITGNLAVNGNAITADGATLTINAGGTVDIQDSVSVDSLTTDTGGITIATGQDLTIGSIGLNDTGISSITSGAYLVGVYPTNIANSSSTNLQAVLEDLDAAIGGGSSKFSQQTGFIYLTNTSDEVIIGGNASLSSKLAVDGDADEIQLLIQANATQNADVVVFEQSNGTDIFNLTNTGALTLGGSLTVNSDSISDFTGNGLTLASNALTIQTLSASDGLSSTTSNGSGLEVLAGGIGLLQGCDDGELLKWNESNDSWECSTDSGATSAIINVQNNDANVGTNVDTLDFSTDFLLGASPANEVNISVADDILNFTEFSDALTLDAATTITNSLADNFEIDLTSSGDFVISDNGTAFFTFTDGGALTQAGSGQVTLTGNVDATNGLDITGASLTVGGNATITTAGAGTFASTLTANGTLDANGVITLGDGGDSIAIDGDTWDISSAGVGTGFTSLTIDSLLLDGTTVGLTGDSDLLSLASGALTINGTGTFTGDLATQGTTLGLNNDADANNLLGFGSGTASTASGDLFWGNDLVCDVSETNCGFVTSGGSGASKWSVNTSPNPDVTYLTELTFDLAVGGNDSEAPLFVDVSGSALNLNPYGASSGNTGEIRFQELEAGGDNYTGFKAPDALAGDVIYTLPLIDGSNNQVLSTDSSGTLTWIDVSAGAGGYTGWTLSDGTTSQVINSGNTVTTADSSTINAAVSATDTVTYNVIADSLNFTELSNALTLDAATTITNSLAGNLIIDLTSTGDFVISDNGTPFFTFTDNGALTQAGSGQVTLTGNVDATNGLDITGTSLTVGGNATITTAGAGTFASTLTANGTLDANGVITLGDGGDSIAIDGDTWDISSAGVGTGFTSLTVDSILVDGTTIGLSADSDLLSFVSGALTVNGTGTFTGDLATQGTTLGLNNDADANNIFTFNAASASTASGDLYWGDDLLCDVSATNCGWATSGTAFTQFTAAGDSGGGQLITDSNTLSILGGTNGIDTVDSATDTITLNLDTTEIAGTTFGSGAGFTWTFDAGATDPSIDFASNDIDINAALTTFSGTIGIDGTTLGLNNDASANNVLSFGAGPGQATGSLYWGDDLVCDPSLANCGWATASSSPWTTTSNVVNLSTSTDSVTIGSTTALGKLSVDGDADEVQLYIQGNGTQTSNLALFEQSDGNDVLAINNNGDILAGFTQLNGSTTTNGTGSNSGTMILTDASNFDVGNYIEVASTNCTAGVNTCYAKIRTKSSNTITISPNLTWANGSSVTEYHVPELGATNLADTLINRYGRGFFISGIAVGNGTTWYEDGNIQTANITGANSQDFLFTTGDTTTSGNSGNITIDTGSAAGTAGTVNIGNTNASGITIGRSGISTTIAGDLDFTSTAVDIELNDDTTNALTISEGANNYIDIDTNNSTEALSFGNATTNPDYSFLGSGSLSIAGTFQLASGATGINAILDEDTLSSDSATALATQQSIKAYVDAQVGGSAQNLWETFSADSGSTTANTATDTLTVSGGTNGIDTAIVGDTLTLNLDTTEIAGTTFGSGSGFTWTFNAGATDPSIDFASDDIDINAALTTFSGNIAADGTTIGLNNDADANNLIGFGSGTGSTASGDLYWGNDLVCDVSATNCGWLTSGGSGESKWTDSGTITYLTETANDLAVGGTDGESPLYFDTSASALNLNPFGAVSGNTGEIRFQELEAGGDNYTGFKSPDALAGNVIYTLPTADGSNQQVLATDSSGNLSWIDVSAGSGGYTGWTITDGTTPQTIASGNTLTVADSSTINATTSATDTLTYNVIADSLNFSEFASELTLDEATTITNGTAGNFEIDLTSTGDFVISDTGTAFFTFTDGGALTQAGSGQVTLTGNVDASNGLDVTGASLTVGGNATITTAGAITGTTLSDGTASLSSGTLDLGTNTISDGNLNGNWAVNSGNFTGIGTASFGTGNLNLTGTTIGLTSDTNLLSLSDNALTLNGSLTLGSSTTISSILDEDNLVSDSATALATQQSIKAYVDSQVGGSAQDLFETIAVPSGTSPVADSATDTLTLAAGSNITITGDATTDTITIAATDTNTTYSAGNDLDLTGTTFSLETTLDFVDTINLAGTGTLNGLDAVDATSENTIEALIFDADAEAITGVWTVADNTNFRIGTGGDFTINHDATDTTLTSTTGDLVFDNTNTTGGTYITLGTDTSATEFTVLNNSLTPLLTIDGSGQFTLTAGVPVSTILDQDDFLSNSATALATQQSIKAYVDNQIGTSDQNLWETFTADSGSTSANSLTDSFAISGGTNGIDTSISGDAVTLNLDTTEIGSTTFGSGSGFTWTFDGGTTDPSFDFADNDLDINVALTTFSGTIGLEGTTIGLNNDADANNLLGFGSGTGSTASGDLYWGNDLICDVSETNCGWSTGSTTPDFDEVYAQSIINGNLTMEIDNATGLTYDLTTTGDFVIADAGSPFATFTDSGVFTLDSLNLDGTTIGLTTDTDLLSLANGALTVNGTTTTADLTLGLNDASATIATQDTNEDLTINPNGTGNVYFHGSSYNISDTGDFTLGGRLTFENSEYISNETNDQLIFGLGGAEELNLSATALAPSTAEGLGLGSATNEWESLFLGDDNGISFGLNQDWTFGYDEATDDRLELITAGTSGFMLSSAVTTSTGAFYEFDSLTSGTGVLFEYAPASAGTLSGDLFRLNIGPNGTVTGDIFAIDDNGTELFSVNQAKITSGLPHEFSAAGDVSVAYDLVLTNQTAAKIESYGPLTIQSGENFENNDLTLRTYGTGSVIVDQDLYVGEFASSGTAALCWDNSGGSYINDCSGSPVSDYAEIYPTESGTEFGDLVALGSQVATVDFVTTDENGNPDGKTQVQMAKLRKATNADRNTLIGITSRNYSDFTSTGHNVVSAADKPMPVALSGRVPVKVTSENGSIVSGDMLSVSSKPGVVAKATSEGKVIGTALAGYSNPDTQAIGEILVFVNPGWYNPKTLLALSGSGDINLVDGSGDTILAGNESNLSLTSQNISLNGETTIKSDSPTLLSAESYGETTFKVDSAGNTEVGLEVLSSTDPLISGNVCYEQVDNTGTPRFKLVQCDEGGADLAEWYPVEQSAVSNEQSIPQPGDIVSIGSALGTSNVFGVEKTTVEYDSKAIGIVSTKAHTIMGEDVLNWAESAVPVALAGRVPVKIDPSSQAISSGDRLTTSSREGHAMKATQTGYTIGNALEDWTPESNKDTILVFVENSVNLDSRFANDITSEESNTAFSDSFIVSLDSINLLLDEVDAKQSAMQTSLGWDLEGVTEDVHISNLATQDLYVTNLATLESASINSSLVLGNDFVISQIVDDSGVLLGTSINTVDSPLSIQGTASQPLTIMAGKFTIDTEGNVAIAGNLQVEGDIATAGEISAEKLTISNADTASSSTSEVLGSETGGEPILSDSSIGTGVLLKGTTSLEIKTTALSQNSLIYITPTSSTLNKVLYVKGKIVCDLPLDDSDPQTDSECSPAFVIGIDGVVSQDIEFNWWIVDGQPN